MEVTLIVVGVACLVVGAAIAYGILAGKSNSRLKTADEQLKQAESNAERIGSAIEAEC